MQDVTGPINIAGNEVEHRWKQNEQKNLGGALRAAMCLYAPVVYTVGAKFNQRMMTSVEI